ncbi:hypothetical protein Tco_0870482 [Tanacetum coccineum]
MTQTCSGVASLSSSGISFNHYGIGLFFGRCGESVSSESEILVVFGIGMSSTGCSADDYGAGGCDEPEAPESCLLFLLESKSNRGGGVS